MATDFGDESGEKLFDWVLRIGQDASEQAMLASAEKLKNALRNARWERRGKGPEDAAEQPSEWAKLSMEQFASLPEYRSIKEIIAGKLSPGEALPSIRALAKDLKISVITTKRAYDELEADGFLYTVAGKGCFVAEKNLDLVREQQQRELEDHLRAAAALARSCGVSREELSEMLRILTEEDTDL